MHTSKEDLTEAPADGPGSQRNLDGDAEWLPWVLLIIEAVKEIIYDIYAKVNIYMLSNHMIWFGHDGSLEETNKCINEARSEYIHRY